MVAARRHLDASSTPSDADTALAVISAFASPISAGQSCENVLKAVARGREIYRNNILVQVTSSNACALNLTAFQASASSDD